MSKKELLKEFYISDGIRDVNALTEILHDDVILHWDSSEGILILEKEGIIKFS